MRNAPLDPGRLLFAHRKEVVSMRQIKLDVAIRIDHRFVFAVALGLVAVLGIVLLK